MRSHIFRQIFSGILCAGLAVTACQEYLIAQQPPAAPTEEVLRPEELTRILKEEWQFLKEETDAFLQNTSQKEEFETKAEFDERVVRQRQIYLIKVNNRIAEKKFDKRKFAVMFKAVLVAYQPDAQRYSISAGSVVEAPYDASTIKCSVSPNAYLGLSDSIRSGYRTSQLYLKFRPNFNWKTGRENAQQAKNEEADVFFKVNFVLDLTQAEMKKQANLKIVPREISLINQKNQQKLWDGGTIGLDFSSSKPRPVTRKSAKGTLPDSPARTLPRGTLSTTKPSTTKPSTLTNSQQARAYYNKGGNSFDKGDYEQAEKDYKQAISLDPQFVDAYDNLGLVLRRKGDLDNAEYYYKKSIKLNPDGAAAHQNLIQVYFLKNLFDKALNESNELKRINQNDPEGYFSAAKAYMLLKNLDAALDNARTAVKLYEASKHPSLKDGQFILGLIYYQKNDKNNARTFLQKAKSNGLKIPIDMSKELEIP